MNIFLNNYAISNLEKFFETGNTKFLLHSSTKLVVCQLPNNKISRLDILFPLSKYQSNSNIINIHIRN